MNSSSTASAQETALVTNATSTLGHELARELARHGHRLVVVAAIEPEIMDIASRLQSEFGVDVRPVALDLRNDGSVDELFAVLIAAGVGIDILVNIDGDARVTERFLPAMIARGRGRILDLDRIDTAPEPFDPAAKARAAVSVDTGVTVTVLPREVCFSLDNVEPAARQDRSAPTPQEIAAAAYVALITGDRFLLPAPTPAIHAPEPAATPQEPLYIAAPPVSAVAINATA